AFVCDGPFDVDDRSLDAALRRVDGLDLEIRRRRQRYGNRARLTAVVAGEDKLVRDVDRTRIGGAGNLDHDAIVTADAFGQREVGRTLIAVLRGHETEMIDPAEPHAVGAVGFLQPNVVIPVAAGGQPGPLVA